MDGKSFKEMMTLLPTYTVLNACIGLGINTGLFKALCEMNEPVSADELAVKCKVKKRLLIEWLQALVAAKVIVEEEKTGRYELPEEIKEAFKGEDVMALTTFGELALTLGARQKVFTECFREDGPKGLPMSATPEAYDWFEKNTNGTYEAVFERDILDHVEGLREKLVSGVQFIDVGTGSGGVLRVLAERFPKSIFIGVDEEASCMIYANDAAAAAGLTNCSFAAQDAGNLPVEWTGKFDVVFMKDAFHDLSHPRKGASELRRITKDKGTVLITDLNLDTDSPSGRPHIALFTAAQLYYCIPGGIEPEGGDPIGLVRTGMACKDILGEFFSSVEAKRVGFERVLHVCSK